MPRLGFYADSGFRTPLPRPAIQPSLDVGDPLHEPNACVGPIENGPFYAVKIYPGDLGTFAGLKTDALARVLRTDGSPIDGLYAVGADMAHIMGGEYMSGGANLGPALTFGYIAGEHLAAT